MSSSRLSSHCIGQIADVSAAEPDTAEAAPETQKEVIPEAPAKEKQEKPASPSPESRDKSREKRSPTGWLKSANPFAKRKSVDKGLDEPQATAGATAKDDKPPQLPPNQLGDDVPLGVTTDIADLDSSDPPPGATVESKSNGKSPETPQNDLNQSVVNASADGADSGAPADQTNRSPSNPSPQSLRGSRGSVAFPRPENLNANKTNPGRVPTAGGKAVGTGSKEEAGTPSVAALRGSRGSVAFPREENVKAHPTNPSRVPTAGGKAVGAVPKDESGSQSTAALRGSRGSVAFPRVTSPQINAANPGRVPTAGGKVVGAAQTERRKSRTVSAEDLPPLDKQGSHDPETAANTVQNATRNPNKANGEGSSKMAGAVAEPGEEGKGDGVGKSEAAVAPVASETPAVGADDTGAKVEPEVEGEGDGVGKSEAAVAPVASEAPQSAGADDAGAKVEPGVTSEAPAATKTTIAGEQIGNSTSENRSGGDALEAGKEKLKGVKERRGSLVDRIFKRVSSKDKK